MSDEYQEPKLPTLEDRIAKLEEIWSSIEVKTEKSKQESFARVARLEEVLEKHGIRIHDEPETSMATDSSEQPTA